MTLFFPDLNVWLALSVADHTQRTAAESWLAGISENDRIVFSRFTQLGLLRLLTNTAVMGHQLLNLKEAWHVYDSWIADPRVDFYLEPRGVDTSFRRIIRPFASLSASKVIGDCWLLAFAADIQATLVTFDRALLGHARKLGHAATIPA
jgi:toxin-antitoxin system PIN domain toxin